MRLAIVLLTVLASATATNRTTRRSFDGYQVHNVLPTTEAHLNALRDLRKIQIGYDFWTYPTIVQQRLDIMVPPELTGHFRNFLRVHNLRSNITVEDVQKLMEAERAGMAGQPRAPQDFNWTTYHGLDEIYEWLRWLTEQYSGVVTLIVGGSSYEAREILGVKVSYGAGKRGVFIESGIHAREWIAPATVTFVLNELLTSTDPVVRNLAESYDWYFFPSTNPDGYVYTWQTDRMWRKTRKPYGNNYGADPNRNWDYHWMEGGSSINPGDETFAGSEPFSETETRTLSQYITGIADTLVAYLAFHSFGQLVLIPFGHQGLEVPENQVEMFRIGRATANSIRDVEGTVYTVGTIPDTVGISSGASIDWVLGVHRNIRLAYGFELRGLNSFILPPDQIVPCGSEILRGLVTMFKELENPGSGSTTTTTTTTTDNPGSTNALRFDFYLLSLTMVLVLQLTSV